MYFLVIGSLSSPIFDPVIRAKFMTKMINESVAKVMEIHRCVGT